MKQTMTNAWFHRMKAANRQLIKSNGGIEACAEMISMSSTQIGRCHSDKDPDLLPIHVVIQLEAECGTLYVTQAMAELQGCALSDPREKPVDGRCLMRDNAELQQVNSEYQARLYGRTADNVFTPSEALATLRDLQPLKTKISDLETNLTEIIAKGGLKTDLKLVHGRD